MASTAASYPDSCVSTRKIGEACVYPRTNAFRRAVAECMVAIHQIAPELAAYHVSQMDFPELRRRVRLYVAVGVALGARPKRAEPGKIPTGETVDQSLQPQLAIAVRSPSGGGGGGLLIFLESKTVAGGEGFRF